MNHAVTRHDRAGLQFSRALCVDVCVGVWECADAANGALVQHFDSDGSACTHCNPSVGFIHLFHKINERVATP